LITIRQATQADIPTLSALAELIWWQHYTVIITEAQISFMLARNYAPEALQIQMQAKSQTFYLAELEGKAVAYGSFTVKTDGKQTWLYLNKLYALQEMRGMGVGKALLEQIKSEAWRRGILGIRLNVNRYNPTVQWYLTQGFTVFREEMLYFGFGFYMDDYILELAMQPETNA
jgi:GNAT superfamily N-acetyltransferase